MRYFDEYGNSLKKDQIESAITGQKDYTVEDAFFGGCEMRGMRNTQEDRMVAYAFDEFEAKTYTKLSTQQRLDLLQETFALLHQALEQIPESQEVGSTAAIAIISPNEEDYLTIGGLGDATIFEVAFSNNALTPSVQRLNSLHNPTEPSEFERVNAEGGIILNKRIAGTLAISRSFGDNAYIAYGMSHEPEIKTFKKVNFEEKRVFLVVACDGLTEPENFKEPQIANVFVRCSNDKLHQIAKNLAKEALSNGSHDNISVQVCEIKKDSAPFLLAVFDGHGGQDVSEFLRCNFVTIFQHCLLKMQLTLLNDQKDPITPAKSLAEVEKKSKSCLIQYAPQKDNSSDDDESTPTRLEFRRFTI